MFGLQHRFGVVAVVAFAGWQGAHAQSVVRPLPYPAGVSTGSGTIQAAVLADGVAVLTTFQAGVGQTLSVFERAGGDWAFRGSWPRGQFGLSAFSTTIASGDGELFAFLGTLNGQSAVALAQWDGTTLAPAGVLLAGGPDGDTNAMDVLVVDGVVFVTDPNYSPGAGSTGGIAVFEPAEGGHARTQTLSLHPDEEGSLFGGTMAFADGRLYTTSRYLGLAQEVPKDPEAPSPVYPFNGAVHVFERVEGAWVEVDRLLPEPTPPGDVWFGSRITVLGEVVALRETRAGETASIGIYTAAPGTLTLRERVTPPLAHAGEPVLAFAGDTLVAAPIIHTLRKINGAFSQVEPAIPAFVSNAFNQRRRIAVDGGTILNPLESSVQVIDIVTSATPGTPASLLSPPHDALVPSGPTTLSWSSPYAVSEARLLVALDPAFGSIVVDESFSPDTLERAVTLEEGRRHFWKVEALAEGNVVISSEVRTFRVNLTADLNQDGAVNFADVNGVLATYGLFGTNLYGDINNDYRVDFLDLNIVLSRFGATLDE